MIDAITIADALGRPHPTAQQRAVIEAPLQPALVIAGAGSGKTETMANRVLWLLANELVLPSQMLGLTFTRKAAGELGARIRGHIAELADRGMLGAGYDPFDAPTVATYNAYANTIYRDNAIVLGRESDGTVLGEAAAWQLARNTLIRSTNSGLAELDKSLDTVTSAVLGLSRALGENNLRDVSAVRQFVQGFVAVGELPAGGQGEYPDVTGWVDDVGALQTLLDLALEYEAAKRQRGFVEFSDQVSLALEIVRTEPRVAEQERDRFRVVLLDEYQDTSVVQTWLLAELFAGHPVMAVGDPNQSIYGWRGASASNLNEFAVAFGASDARYALSTSWRNGTNVLDAANAIVDSFGGHSVGVEKLTPSATATRLPVDSIFTETVVEEADAAAEWLKARLVAKGGTTPTAAMLFRSRKTQRYFLGALRRQDIRFHVLGIAGLLAEPEIADLVSALTVVHDPGAGLELIRLLAGSRWRIGVQDLHALNRLASWLRDRDYAQQKYDDEVVEQLRRSVAEGEGGSIVDALDFVATAKDGHIALAEFTEVGRERLRDAARTFAKLRSRASLDLPDFVALVLHEFQLDIEVIANDYRTIGTAAIEAFFDALDSYLSIDENASLRGFLSWLREAEKREDLSPRPEEPEPGTVQVLTIHGAKGLEWDLVVVPRLVEDELPGLPAEGGFKGWLSFGQLPWPLRGDAAQLPVFEWEAATTRKEAAAARKQFTADVKRHLGAEEGRLAYVAVTRARHSLLLSGSFWSTQKAARKPSRFLTAVAEAGMIQSLPAASAFDENPMGDNLEQIVWPLDPLGSRRPAVERAAAAVRAAEPRIAGAHAQELELLLEERRRFSSGGLVPLPVRVPASRFKDYLGDSASVASSLRRPMPERPYRATQLGTFFHAWVEHRSTGVDTPELDALPTELDDGDYIDAAALDRLRAVFEASPWAHRKPVEVEREIHLPFDGQVIVCKIDAVYALGPDRFEIVDWKTGKAPSSEKDLEEKQLQLALYRLAYAKWRGIDPSAIDAVFYYVSDDRTIRPERIFDEAELLERWRAVYR
ncbi:MAG: ATP-dependent helicase [Salinibacterium sp.]|nr:MAG: ATP-dependent helicase [Salinibacterium sp.]